MVSGDRYQNRSGDGVATPPPGLFWYLSPETCVAEALAALAGELLQAPPEAVMLPLVPAWCDANAGPAQRTWPAEELVGRFFDVLTRLAAAA